MRSPAPAHGSAPPIGLVGENGTPTPAYEELHRLIKHEWWHGPTTLTTDEHGRARVRGFRGNYTATIGYTETPFSITGDVEVARLVVDRS